MSNKPTIIKREEQQKRRDKERRAKMTLVQLLIEDLAPEDARKIIYDLRQKSAQSVVS